MANIYVQEARSEVLVVLDRHTPDRLSALQEAYKILGREVLREQSNPSRNADWGTNGNQLPAR